MSQWSRICALFRLARHSLSLAYRSLVNRIVRVSMYFDLRPISIMETTISAYYIYVYTPLVVIGIAIFCFCYLVCLCRRLSLLREQEVLWAAAFDADVVQIHHFHAHAARMRG